MTQANNQSKELPTLRDLFAEADRVGDKYLTADEIQTRDADLAAAIAAVDEMFKPGSKR